MDPSHELTIPPQATPSDDARHQHEAASHRKEKPGKRQALLDLERHAEVSEERFRELVESAHAIVWEADAATLRLTFVSQGAERILGFSPGQWLQTPNFWADHLHPQDRERALGFEQATLNAGKAGSVQYRMEGADGRFRWFRDFMHVVQGSEGKAKVLRGIMVDITESKQAEETLRIVEEEYRQIFEQAPVGIIRTSVEGDCLSANPAFAQILGYDSVEDVVLSVSDSGQQVWGDPQARRAYVMRIEEQEVLRGYECQFSRKDGAVIWVSVSGRRVAGRDGRTLYYESFIEDITQRRRMEEALRESEERFRSLVENVTVGIYRTTPEGRVLAANPALVRMLGYKAFEELSARNLEKEGFEPHYPRRTFREQMDREGVVKGLESAWLRHDGTPVFVRESAKAIYGENKQVVYYDGVAEDITERKREEEARRRAEEDYRNIFEHALEGIYRTSPEGKCLAANPALAKMLGYESPQEVVSSVTDSGRQAWRDLDERVAFTEQVEKQEAVRDYKCQLLRKDGTTIWVSHNCQAIRGPDGQTLYYEGFIEGITERKQAEEALRESEARERAKAEELQALLDTVPVAVFVSHDPECKGMTGNRAAHELVRVPAGANPSKSAPENERPTFGVMREGAEIPAEDLPMQRAAATGTPIFDSQFTIVFKDGTERHVSGNAAPLFDVEGKPCGAIGGFLDITERKRAEEERQRSLEQLRALAGRLQHVREEERKRLAREIHDQLGQALTAIKLDFHSLIHEMGGDPQRPSKRAASMLKLMDETIQSVRRISTELRPGMLDDLGLVATIEWAAGDFQARTGTQCRLDLPPEDVAIDPERATAIFRILQEILTNVARHADASEVEVRLAKEKEKENGNLTLLVHDNGKGMPADKPYSRKSLGILGMQERAFLLGGEVMICSSPGEGTTVRVRIPEGRRR